MRKFTTTLMCSGMLMLGAHAMAADPMPNANTKDDMAMHDSMMKDCMAKQKDMNSTMSSDDMTKACKTKMTEHDSMMKDCMAKQKQMNAGMSMDDMKKACKTQMMDKMGTSK
jgi:hypothetical protein